MTSTQTAHKNTADSATTESSGYETLKNNVSYLAYGSAAGAAVPASLKTRTLLKTTRYVLKYIAFRLLRYAKYAVIVSTAEQTTRLPRVDLDLYQGSIGAALGGSLLASIASGAAFFVAPSALISTGVGIGWAVLKVSPVPPSGPPIAKPHLR